MGRASITFAAPRIETGCEAFEDVLFVIPFAVGTAIPSESYTACEPHSNNTLKEEKKKKK